MKQQAIQHVALDVHQATLVVSVRDEQGAVVMRATAATEAKAIVGLTRGLGSRVHLVFEEGTQARWLYDLLKPHVERVVVCNTRGRGSTDGAPKVHSRRGSFATAGRNRGGSAGVP